MMSVDDVVHHREHNPRRAFCGKKNPAVQKESPALSDIEAAGFPTRIRFLLRVEFIDADSTTCSIVCSVSSVE